MLFRIQNELDELKEAHRRALRVKSKLIKVMEREVAELKQQDLAKKEEKMEALKSHYNKIFLARRDTYKVICKQKVLEYKLFWMKLIGRRLLQNRCNEVINKMKDIYKRKERTP